MTYPKDHDRPPQYPQQGYGQQQPQDKPRQNQQYPQDAPWRAQQYDPHAHQQRLGTPLQGTAGQQDPWQPQPWEHRNRQQQQPYGQPWPPQDQQDASQPPPWQQQSAVPPQTPKGRKRKSWPVRHKVLTGLIAFGALVVIIAAASASNKPSTAASDTGAAGTSASPSAAVSSARASSAPSTPAAPVSPSMTGAQQQAVDAAEDYLSDGQGFSEQGLLSQLTSSAGDGFSNSDAEFAINYLDPNWDQQVVDAAKGYLSGGQGFSEQGLLQQLTSSAGDGFTEAQAEYATNSLHPDWDAQAVDAAKGYMQMGGFSQASLIQQLTSSAGNGFTQTQAEYAASQVGL
jgi:host cell surface-exposed lipoprotein